MKLTIQTAAKIMGIADQSLRIGLQHGVFEFGIAFKQTGSTRYTYILYPEKFYTLYGKGQG